MLLAYISPIVLITTGLISSPIVAILWFLVGGLGIAGIGMGIMHDANHGAYTKSPRMTAVLGHTLDFMGCSSAMWKLQHNVLHHTYTNVHGHDEDIDPPHFLLRFSPHGEPNKAQRFQHYYVWLFYSVLTLYWVVGKDFVKANDYYKKGLIATKKELNAYRLKFIPLKLFYLSYALVLPMIFAPFSAWYVLLGFVLMHMLAGVVLSITFQLAHVVPGMDFPLSDEEDTIDSNWHIHQMQTTSNFSPKNKLLFWYMGGLTNQIEHHLFPNICHVHYQKISKLVERTAKDHNVPYYVNRTFLSAVAGHIRTLKNLGRMSTTTVN